MASRDDLEKLVSSPEYEYPVLTPEERKAPGPSNNAPLIVKGTLRKCAVDLVCNLYVEAENLYRAHFEHFGGFYTCTIVAGSVASMFPGGSNLLFGAYVASGLVWGAGIGLMAHTAVNFDPSQPMTRVQQLGGYIASSVTSTFKRIPRRVANLWASAKDCLNYFSDIHHERKFVYMAEDFRESIAITQSCHRSEAWKQSECLKKMRQYLVSLSYDAERHDGRAYPIQVLNRKVSPFAGGELLNALARNCDAQPRAGDLEKHAMHYLNVILEKAGPLVPHLADPIVRKGADRINQAAMNLYKLPKTPQSLVEHALLLMEEYPEL